MIILFPVPLWFLIAGLIVSVAFVLHEIAEDAEINSVRRWPEKPPEVLDALAKRLDHHLNAYKVAEAERLLKRLAETRT
jgi:hypothetical protein